MSNKRENPDVGRENLDNKRLKSIDNERTVLIDLTNSQSNSNETPKETGPSERQLFFLSQFYNSSKPDKKTCERKFPGPAGFLGKFYETQGKQVKSTRRLDSKNKSEVTKKDERLKSFQVTRSSERSLPDSNYAWVEMKKYFRLSNSDENDLLNKINIGIVEEKMRGWNSSHPRISIPFLAAVVSDDGGIGAVSNVVERKTCISLTLEDFTGSITAVLDGHALFHLGHLIQKGTALILTQPEVHKVYGKLNLSVSKDMVTCIAVNNENGNLKMWKDVPFGFGSIERQNHVIIFEQADLNQKRIHHEVSIFKDRVNFRRSSSSFAQINSSRCITESKNESFEHMSVVGHVKKGESSNSSFLKTLSMIDNKTTEENQTKQVGTKEPVSREFEESSDTDSLDLSVIELVEKCEEEYMKMKDGSSTNAKTPAHQNYNQLPIPTVEEIPDNNDDCNFDDSLIEFVDKCARKIESKKNDSVANHEVASHQKEAETSSIICGEFGDDDNDDDDLSLLEAVEKIEQQSPISIEKQNRSKRENIVGEFDEGSDEEFEALMVGVFDESCL